MFRDPRFWEKESKAILLDRNNDWVTQSNADERCQRVEDMLLPLLPKEKDMEYSDVASRDPQPTDSEEMNRIFKQDAIRTFSSDEFQKVQVETLYILYSEIKDYHQGLGFIVAFLLLFLSQKDVIKVALYLNDTALRGYCKIHNHNYLRDARVLETLLLKKDKKLGEHLQMFTVPGQYCSKWWIGMMLHCMPFSAIATWYSNVLREGDIHLFKFGLGLFHIHRQALLAMKDTQSIINLFKFDRKIYPDAKASAKSPEVPGSFFTELLEGPIDVQLDRKEVEDERKAIEELMADEERRRKEWEQKMAAEESDIVFSDEEEYDHE